MNEPSTQRFTILSSIGLFAAILILRISIAAFAPEFAGYSPLIAIILCLSIVLVRPALWLVPAAAYLVSDLIITTQVYGNSPSLVYPLTFAAFFIGLVVVGRTMKNRLTRFVPTLLATAGGTFGFYLLANTMAWIADPGYAKSLAAWFQSQTIGLPGYPSSLAFLRSQMIGNLAFAAAFVALAHRLPTKAESTSHQPLHNEA